MKIVVLQLNFTVGDIKGNQEKILKEYLKVCRNGAELVICSELSLIGYPAKDLLLSKTFLDKQYYYLNKLNKRIRKIGLIVGIAERKGKKLFNSAVLFQFGKMKIVARKRLLPNYDVFDESRYFSEGSMNPLIINYKYSKEEKRISIFICEDIWYKFRNKQNIRFYTIDPLSKLINKSIDLLVVINASPFYLGKSNERLKLVSYIAKKFKAYVIYSNQVGGNDDLIFDGNSLAINSKGNIISVAKSFREDSLYIDESYNGKSVTYSEDKINDLFDALVLGTKDYFRKIKNKRGAIIGISGGIDSAVTAVLAVRALGANKVIGVTMPTEYTSETSIKDSINLAKKLKIKLYQINIDNLLDGYKRSLLKIIGWKEPGVDENDSTEENFQARIRGNILMGISNRTGKILLSTGNKSEIAVGYCTLYGDLAGGLAILSDVLKTKIYKIAEFINKDNEVIPKNIILKKPSAELYHNQLDTDKLPEYNILDTIISEYINGTKKIEDISSRNNIDLFLVNKIVKMINKNEYKRKQMPIGLIVTSKAFNFGRKIPIAANFKYYK